MEPFLFMLVFVGLIVATCGYLHVQNRSQPAERNQRGE